MTGVNFSLHQYNTLRLIAVLEYSEIDWLEIFLVLHLEPLLLTTYL